MSRVWLITGANSGFGRALTAAAVAAGDVVIAAARRPETLADVVAAHPDQVEAVALDVTDLAGVNATVASVIARHGRLDVLVNNAGRSHVGAFEETTDEELRSLFDVHVFGPAALVRAALPHMRARRSGAIVQLSSLGGQLSFAGFSAYSGTKFALEGLSEGLADEVGRLGIKVLIVEPGAFRTGLWGSTSRSVDEIEDYTESVGPTRRMVVDADGTQAGDPAKAAAAILTALDAPEPPLRLALGADAVEAIGTHLDQVRGDLTTWEGVARATAFDHAG
ncbi:oxidoreductase [Amycolatopsis rhabdoformis]|uniref:Oxidoreductase n=1 Tax=Amycolatopsis rhabdoformis TaxID=1448059 RepID=A0ABZ1I0S1_9PSEU|nr:oxidoreductase [Amycolatopsis rhabdoformis]WSE27259.1 oxidoreductase [Amycolatopsis rhabdoformis]